MRKRIMSVFLVLSLVISLLPVSVVASEPEKGSTENTISSTAPASNEDALDESKAEYVEDTAAQTEMEITPNEAAALKSLPNGTIYVSAFGSDTGNGTVDSPYATLTKAVEVAQNGDIVQLLTDLDASVLAYISDKDITIDGGGHTVTRAQNFTPKYDTGRGGYNPELIEVANGATLTLKNITLDDANRTNGSEYLEQLTGDGDKHNEQKVQGAIIAAFGDGKGTIILEDGAILKNFGGMSAVRIGGNTDSEGKWYGSTLVMKNGSKIIDDAGMGETGRKGGVAAVWSQGGKLEMQNGSEISNIDGRAIYLEDGGIADIDGAIHDITANSVMTYDPEKGTGLGSGAQGGFGGIALAARGNSTFTLGEGGTITRIASDEQKAGDVAVMLDTSSTFATESNSTISNIDTIGLVENNEGKIIIGGTVSNCHLKNVFFRLRGGGMVTFELLESGSITNNETTDVGLLYRNGGKINVNIAGTIDGFNKTVLYLSSNNHVKDGTATVASTGKIKNITATAIKAESSGTLVISGEISNCSGYAVTYEPKGNQQQFPSLFKIERTATIKDNNDGDAQIQIIGDHTATNLQEHAVIAPEGLIGNTTIDLKAFDVTLDENYDDVKLGNASSSVIDEIETSVYEKYPDWTKIGSSALWFQPSETSFHFIASKPNRTKNTGLFVAYLPLDEDGTAVSGSKAVLKEVTNSQAIDVDLENLVPGQSYALMFFNNKEYTLRPDDITIYTGGGQNDEIYDNGGLPKLTLNNCIDQISNNTEVQIDGIVIPGDAAAKMQAIIELFTVIYTDQDGNEIKDDETPGEYTATLTWKDGQERTITIAGNSVKSTFENGTLIIRHTEDQAEAEAGTNTYPLLGQELPTEPVTHAEAYANKGFGGYLDPVFYINNDTNRKITDTAGISILDDSLLLEHENDNRQQLLEDRATEDVLEPLDETKTYVFDFHYLDLVDAYNGNAWVSASYGTTVYLPYPAGTNSDTVFTLVHYKDLHREYGISGQANVEEAINACEVEKVGCTNTAYGIKFDVPSSGFSPFALVWAEEAYTITASAGENGSITPNGVVKVAKGREQSFTITADAGYHISDVKVDGKSVGAVSSYVFQNVIADHTIKAEFAIDGSGGVTEYFTLSYETNGGNPIPSESNGFAWVKAYKDLPVPTRNGFIFDGWYLDSGLTQLVTSDVDVNTSSVTLYAGWHEDVSDPDDTGVSDWLNTKDHFSYFHGYETGTFYPEREMTRAEAAQIFYNVLLNQNVPITVSFSDVPEDAWYADAVNTLASLGFIKGIGANRFNPERSITRAEFTAIAMRFTNGGQLGENIFSDIDEEDWYYEPVVRSIQYGWIKGYEDGTFHPNHTISRAEVTAVANRMLGRSADKTYINQNIEKLHLFPDVDRDYWAFYHIVEATNGHEYTKHDGLETWDKLGA
jgi:uncharacterized repeat protein (TIGR02543 family)